MTVDTKELVSEKEGFWMWRWFSAIRNEFGSRKPLTPALSGNYSCSLFSYKCQLRFMPAMRDDA